MSSWRRTRRPDPIAAAGAESPFGIGDVGELTAPGLVELRMDVPDRAAAARVLAERMAAEGRLGDVEGFLREVASREHQLATALPGGIGMPHARTRHVAEPTVAVGVPAFGRAVDYGAADGPATLVLLLATPATSYSVHLGVLAALARSLAKPAFRESLRRADDADAIAGLINSTVDFTNV